MSLIDIPHPPMPEGKEHLVYRDFPKMVERLWDWILENLADYELHVLTDARYTMADGEKAARGQIWVRPEGLEHLSAVFERDKDILFPESSEEEIMENMIDVTDANPIDLIKAAYALSVPVGLGFLHATDGPLSDMDAQSILDAERPDGRIVASMDYVHGRQVKMTIFRKDGRHHINKEWYDHTPAQLEKLLDMIGVGPDL